MIVNIFYFIFYIFMIKLIIIKRLVVFMKLDYKDDFNEILRKLRLKNNLSQKELAQKLNISLSTYSKYEQGLNNPTYENLFKISNFFKLSVGSFLKENIEDEKEITNFENYLKENFPKTFDIENELKEIIAYIKHSQNIKLTNIQRAILEILIYSNYDFFYCIENEKEIFKISDESSDNILFSNDITTENLLKILGLLHYDLVMSFRNYLELVSEK